VSQAVQTVAPLFPGPLANIANAIQAQLQLGFPPSLFQFKFLPGKLDKAAWSKLTQFNQPFIGLGFGGITTVANGRAPLIGQSKWTLVVAVRRSNISPGVLFYGDAQGPGVTLLATTAMSLLHGFNCDTGTALVESCSNIAPDEFGEDSALIAINFSVPLTLDLPETITPPALNLFEENSETWNWPAGAGSTDFTTSDWINPNV
jgi:hypothetical protein